MKRLLLISLVASIVLASCKKGNDTPDSYLKLKINGAWVTWKSALGELGPDLADPSKTDLGLTATDDAQKDIFDFTIQVDGNNFQTGTYMSDNPAYLMVMSYYRDANAANSNFFDIATAPSMPESKFIINITSITSSHIEGNFNGNYLYDSFDDVMLGLTEGEFRVRRIR